MTKLNSFLSQISSSKNGGPLAAPLSGSMGMGVVGPFPLSRMTDLTDAGVKGAFGSGEVRVELSNLAFAPLKIVDAHCTSGQDGSGTVTVVLAPMALNGQYRLFAIEQPRLDLDTGGSMLPFTVRGSSGDPATITEEEFDQLTQARLQKSILQTTKNGQQLLSSYNTYNDAYNQVLQSNTALQKYWNAGGATAAMAAQTSNALNTDDIINSSQQTYGGATYNDNAFQQETHLFAACLGAQLYDAANAVPTFAASVNTTGNTQTNTTPMTGSSVYAAVNATHPTAFATALKAGPTARHHAMAKVAKNEHTDDDLTMLKGHGYKLTAPMIQAIQEIYAEGARQVQPKNQAGLWQGSISAALPQSSFVFHLKDHGNGVVATNLKRHDLPVPDLRMDDSSWAGAAGQIARKRLSSAHFIRSLLLSRIANAIEQNVADCVSKYADGDAGA